MMFRDQDSCRIERCSSGGVGCKTDAKDRDGKKVLGSQ
jgi:hypothetical protein